MSLSKAVLESLSHGSNCSESWCGKHFTGACSKAYLPQGGYCLRGKDDLVSILQVSSMHVLLRRIFCDHLKRIGPTASQFQKTPSICPFWARERACGNQIAGTQWTASSRVMRKHLSD